MSIAEIPWGLTLDWDRPPARILPWRSRTDDERRHIANRAHELRSCKAAAEEAHTSTKNVLRWIEAGLSDYEGLPGNRLPADKVRDLRSGVWRLP